ncbi:MAG: DNA polymerase III subunit delta [Parachlamydiales bacterium]
MKSADPNAFLALKELPPLTLITGGSPYDREGLLRKQGLSGGLSCDELSPKRLAEELSSGSLFSQRRTLLLRRLSHLSEEGSGLLVTYCERPGPELRVVAEGESCPAGLAASAGLHLDLGKLPPWEEERAVVSWLQKEGNLPPQLAALLVERASPDKERLALELEKLRLHGGPVTRELIEALVPASPHGSVWEVGRAILTRDPKRAAALLEAMGEGIGLFGTLAALRSQFETHLLALEGGPADLPKLKGRQLERTVELARRYGGPSLRQGLVAIGRLEGEAKRRALSEEAALLQLVTALAS